MLATSTSLPTNGRARRLRRTAGSIGVAGALLSGLAVLGTANPASAASSPYLSSQAGVRNCVARSGGTAEKYPERPGCTSILSLPKGTKIQMTCWRDDAWNTGQYRSNRWFYVVAGSTKGFVHSSRVAAQTPRTPECGTHRGVTVTRWAAEHVGATDPTAKERSVAGIPSNQYWSGWCAGFALDAYAIGAGSRPRITGQGSAKAWFDAYARAGRTQGYSRDINVGSLVFWRTMMSNGRDVTGGYGHVAVYVGNGEVVTTRGSGGERRAIERRPLSAYSTPSGVVTQPNV